MPVIAVGGSTTLPPMPPMQELADVVSPLVAMRVDDGGNIGFLDLPLLIDTFNPLDWRTEVKGNGQYWQWRKGSGSNRSSRYGGTFDQLSDERKAAYEAHKQRRAATDQTGEPTGSAGDVAERLGVFTAERSASAVSDDRGGLTASA